MKSNGKAHVRVTCDDTCGIYPPISRIVGFLALPELPISRLTLRLPVTLHRQLEKLAKREQTSLNQYLVYVLARQAIEAYTVHELPEEAVTQQRTAFPTLLQNLGHASSDQI